MGSIAQAYESHTGKMVLLIEPDDAIRQSLLSWLQSAMPECHTAGAASAKEAKALLQFESPSIVLVDIADPDVDGVETIKNIKGAMRRAHVVALTMSDLTEYRESLACAGASACLLIWETQCELVATIRALLAGKSTQEEHNAIANHPDSPYGVN